jgi:hypothetical protein
MCVSVRLSVCQVCGEPSADRGQEVRPAHIRAGHQLQVREARLG